MKPSSAISEESIPLSPHMATAFGVPCALLIQQIHYWCLKKTHRVDGHYWVYKTLKEWAEEIKVVDIKTIQRSLEKLRDMGIVITDNFNRKKYDRTLWYRIDHEALSKHLIDQLPEWAVAVNANGQFVYLPVDKMSAPIPENTKTENTEEKNTLVRYPAGISQGLAPQPPLKSLSGKKIIVVKGPTSAKSILDAHKAKLGKTPAVAPNTNRSLELIWNTVPQYNEGVTFMPALTMRQRGALSYMRKSWGLTSDLILKHLVSHWIGYTKFVMKQAGIKHTPNVPSLEFVQRHHGLAVDFYREAHPVKSPKTTHSPVQPPVQPSVQPIASPVPSAKKADAEQAQSTLVPSAASNPEVHYEVGGNPTSQTSEKPQVVLPKSSLKLLTKVKKPQPQEVVPKDSAASEKEEDEVASLEEVLKWKTKVKDHDK